MDLFFHQMATLDDKLLGEKLHYYCSSSSSEDEGEDGVGALGGGGGGDGAPAPGPRGPSAPGTAGSGSSSNTGPKGVIEDWRKYKQLQAELKEGQDAERVALAKRLTMACRTDREEQEARERQENLADLENLLQDGGEDEFMQSYMLKRMEEMMLATQEANRSKKKFGLIFDLQSGDEFLTTVDNPEDKATLVVVYIYEDGAPGCDATYGCLKQVAKDYSHLKFCRIRASAAGLSRHFKSSGVPAILVYKAGELFASLIRITDALGEDFFVQDLESYLMEHGVLPDKCLLGSSAVRGPSNHAGQPNDGADSD